MTNSTDRLKIALLIKSFVTTGGSEKYAVEVASRLAARGHRIDLYTRNAAPELIRGMNFYKISDRLTFSSVLGLYSFAREAIRLLQGKSYDVIHTHERGQMPQDISTLHSFSYRGGGYMSYPLSKKILQVYLSPRSWLHLWLEDQQMRAPWLVAVSDAIRQDTEKYYGRQENVSVITPGVDTAWFNPDWIVAKRHEFRLAELIPENELVILFVGSEFKRKGLDRLIPALGSRMRLLVVGRGERLSSYQALVNQHGLTGRVDFKGLSDDVRRFYAMADVVVLPSRSEAFGMTVLEGMACGLPVVVSANAGAAALIKDGDNGIICHDPADLKNIFITLLNKEKRLGLGQRARKTAEEFVWDRIADKYESLYYQVAGQKK